MNDAQKNILLKIARDSIQAAVTDTPAPDFKTDDPQLNANCGCFVTLKNGPHLRGCIGQFISDKPLVNLISEVARSSATSDPRFIDKPITLDEMPSLNIEISVLSPLKKTDDPMSLRLGIDGIYIRKKGRSGCFLPQVAEETNWTKKQFLSYCCSHKAGLSPDAWKDPQTEVFLFTAEIFSQDFSKI